MAYVGYQVSAYHLLFVQKELSLGFPVLIFFPDFNFHPGMLKIKAGEHQHHPISFRAGGIHLANHRFHRGQLVCLPPRQAVKYILHFPPTAQAHVRFSLLLLFKRSPENDCHRKGNFRQIASTVENWINF